MTTLAIVALLLVIALGVIWLGGAQLTTGVESATAEINGVDSPDNTEIHAASRRRDIWQATWLMFKAHPLAGAGLGGYWAEVPIFHSASGVLTPQQAHNDYLEVLASGGILGAALLLWFVVALIRQARQSVQCAAGFQRAVLLGTIVGIVGVGVHSMVDFGLHITINALVFVILLGMLCLKPMGNASEARG